MDFTWQDPPRSKSSPPGERWIKVRAELRNHPGRWARFEPRRTIGGWSGMQRAFKRDGFEATIRTIDGQFVLYARWPEVCTGSDRIEDD